MVEDAKWVIRPLSIPRHVSMPRSAVQKKKD